VCIHPVATKISNKWEMLRSKEPTRVVSSQPASVILKALRALLYAFAVAF